MRRVLVIVLGLVVAVASGCADDGGAGADDRPVVPTTAPAATTEVDGLTWRACDDLECTTVAVPVDHDDPDGPTIELAVARAPSDGDDVIGSLLLNPGGPGVSAIEYLRSFAIVAPEALRERFHLVAVDPRGVGESESVDCGWVLDDETVDPNLGTDDVATRVPYALELQAADAADCVEGVGEERLVRLGTVATARDLDLVREALGDEALSYLGFSYGTKIGAVYADLFPDRVRVLALDGADRLRAQPDDVIAQYEGFEEAFDAFAANCEAFSTCDLSETEIEGYVTAVDDVLRSESLPAGTADDGSERRLTRDELYVALLAALYDTTSWSSLAAGLELAAEDGDGTVLQQLTDGYLERRPDGSYADTIESFVAVTCSDDAHRPTDAEVAALAEQAADVLDVFRFVAPEVGVGCYAWPDAVDPIPEIDGAGAPPILVIGTTGDPATPYAWAVEMADQLESAELLTYEGVVHTAFWASDCVRDHVVDYLVTTELPDIERCAA